MGVLRLDCNRTVFRVPLCCGMQVVRGRIELCSKKEVVVRKAAGATNKTPASRQMATAYTMGIQELSTILLLFDLLLAYY